jgi:hypothetical protein
MLGDPKSALSYAQQRGRELTAAAEHRRLVREFRRPRLARHMAAAALRRLADAVEPAARRSGVEA